MSSLLKTIIFAVLCIALIVFLCGVLFFLYNGFSSLGESNAVFNSWREKSTQNPEKTPLPVVANPILIRKSSPLLTVPHAEGLDPSINLDKNNQWAFLATVRVKKFSGSSNRQIFAIKYDSRNEPFSGWGLAFHEIEGVVFPEVYWGSAQKRGAWYRYPPIGVQPGEWWVLGVSFESGKYLVLRARQVASQNQNREVIVGAHDLSPVGAASSTGNFMFGAPPGSSFKGAFGFLGIFEVKKPSFDLLVNGFSEMQQSPKTLQDDPKTENTTQSFLASIKKAGIKMRFGTLDGTSDLAGNHVIAYGQFKNKPAP
jgi:hypothetical protein